MESNDNQNGYVGFFTNQRSADMILKIFFSLICFLVVLLFAAWHITRKNYKFPPKVPIACTNPPLTVFSRQLQRDLSSRVLKEKFGSIFCGYINRDRVIVFNSIGLINAYVSRKRMDHYYTEAPEPFCYHWRGLLFSRFSVDRSIIRKLTLYAFEDMPVELIQRTVQMCFCPSECLPINELDKKQKSKTPTTTTNIILTGSTINDCAWFIMSRTLLGFSETNDTVYDMLQSVAKVLRCFHLGICRHSGFTKGKSCLCNVDEHKESTWQDVLNASKDILQPLIRKAMEMDVDPLGNNNSSNSNSHNNHNNHDDDDDDGMEEQLSDCLWSRMSLVRDSSTSPSSSSSTNHPRCNVNSFIEQFLLTKTACDEEEEAQLQFLNVTHLSHIVAESAYAGWECLSVMIRCALLYLAKNPKFQSELREEMRELDRLNKEQLLQQQQQQQENEKEENKSNNSPEQQEREQQEKFANTRFCRRGPRVRALSFETLRWIAPLSKGFNVYVAERDGKVEKYDYSEGDILLMNDLAYYFKAKHWGENPEEFLPERFLSMESNELILPKHWPLIMCQSILAIPLGFLAITLQFVLLNVCDKYKVTLLNEDKNTAANADDGGDGQNKSKSPNFDDELLLARFPKIKFELI